MGRVQAENFRDQGIDIHIFKGWHADTCTDIRAGRDEERFHLRHAGGVIPVIAWKLGLWLARILTGANGVWSGGNDDRITGSGIAVKVEPGGDLGAAVNLKLVALSAQGFVCVLRILVGVWIKRLVHNFFEPRSLQTKLIEQNHSILHVCHAVVCDYDYVHGQVHQLEAGDQAANLGVEFVDRGSDLRTVGAVLVTGMVDVLKNIA